MSRFQETWQYVFHKKYCCKLHQRMESEGFMQKLKAGFFLFSDFHFYQISHLPILCHPILFSKIFLKSENVAGLDLKIMTRVVFDFDPVFKDISENSQHAGLALKTAMKTCCNLLQSFSRLKRKLLKFR